MIASLALLWVVSSQTRLIQSVSAAIALDRQWKGDLLVCMIVSINSLSKQNKSHLEKEHTPWV